LSSFIKGFGRNDASDIINALFVAKNLSKLECPFPFENRDNNGVDSPEIRKLIFFNNDALKDQEEIPQFHQMGERMSKMQSKELKWVAQYLKNGETHLFPNEAKKAKKSLKQLELPTT
jgi:hypothetical protein